MTDTLTHPALTDEVRCYNKADRAVWQSVIVDSMTEAAAVLDWAEVHGFRQRRFEILGDSEFEVQWR